MQAAARQLRTDAEPSKALIFVEPIRLKCQICGVIVQPSDMDRVLWDDDICPSCNDKTFKKMQLSADFDSFVESKANAIGNKITALSEEIRKLREEYNSMIDEGDSLCKKFNWLTGYELRKAKSWRDVDFLF